MVADTHCIRITGLLGLTDGSKDPVKVEMQLRRVLPPEESNDFCHRLVLHGRAVCIARRPPVRGSVCSGPGATTLPKTWQSLPKTENSILKKVCYIETQDK